MEHVIAVANQKGGAGKTTTTVNLAAALGAAGVPTLVVDLDPQASASAWLGVAEPDDTGLLDALTRGSASLAELARESSAPGVEVVPSSGALAHAERELGAVPGGDLALRRLVEGLPARRWRVVLFDCPPQLGRLTSAVLLAARGVLVPVEASSMALAGLTALLTTLGRACQHNPALVVRGILACRVDYRNNLSREVVAALAERFPEECLRTVIRERVRLREAPSYRVPVNLYDPDGDAAQDFAALARELFPGEVGEGVRGRAA